MRAIGGTSAPSRLGAAAPAVAGRALRVSPATRPSIRRSQRSPLVRAAPGPRVAAGPAGGSPPPAGGIGSAGRQNARRPASSAAAEPSDGPGSATAEAVAPAARSWPGAKPIPLLASVAVGAAVRFLVPIPEGVTVQGWSLLAIFLSTIAGLILEPLPVGAWAFLSATVTVAAGVLPFRDVFGAFTNDVIWLIVVSFFFAKGFEKTGLGARVATLFVRAFGKSTLGLAYGLAAAEALIAPAMPSTTARAGGIFVPIISSLALANGSKPNEASRRRLGAFLVQAQFQGSVNTSALFLTAAAQSLLCVKLAGELGVPIPSAWVSWFKAASVPAVAGILVTPALLYKLFPPELKSTPEAPRLAAERLKAMGPMSRDEKLMLATMAGAVALWVAGDAIGVSAVTTAMLGLSALLGTGVLTWRDCVAHPAAWDTLFWFSILVGMSGQLNALGVVSHFAGSVGAALQALRLGPAAVFALLNAAYFFLHYLFASQTAHVGALYAAFLAMMLAAGVPPVISALSLGYVSNLFGSVTHFGSGQAAVYYGSGYLTLAEVFGYGALMTLVNATIWGVLGTAWWKWLGLL